jgi:hypothetical protein
LRLAGGARGAGESPHSGWHYMRVLLGAGRRGRDKEPAPACAGRLRAARGGRTLRTVVTLQPFATSASASQPAALEASAMAAQGSTDSRPEAARSRPRT